MVFVHIVVVQEVIVIIIEMHRRVWRIKEKNILVIQNGLTPLSVEYRKQSVPLCPQAKLLTMSRGSPDTFSPIGKRQIYNAPSLSIYPNITQCNQHPPPLALLIALCPSPSYRKPKPLHTVPIPLHRILTRNLGIRRVGEQHTFVAGGFFVFAHAAGLFSRQERRALVAGFYLWWREGG